MKKNTQNKTDFIQFRVDSTVKDLAKKTANEHFDGNMSDMFRYSLYHCNFCGAGDNAELDRLGNSFTRMSDDASKMLAAVHDDYINQNRELNRIGNNINQIAYHVNAQAKSCPSPVTRQAADNLDVIRKAMNSARTDNANIWKREKEYFTTVQQR